MNAIPLEYIKRHDHELINSVFSSLWLPCEKWTTSGARVEAQRPLGKLLQAARKGDDGLAHGGSSVDLGVTVLRIDSGIKMRR